MTQINGSGNPYGASDNYLSIFTGRINVTTAGNYRFAVDGDDAVEVLIDGVVRYGWYSSHAGPCSCTTYRSADFYTRAPACTRWSSAMKCRTGPGSYYLQVERPGFRQQLADHPRGQVHPA
ncbi:MAG: PA14 domain-containing protein [Desulfomicrobium escambiense]|nr:PA14 domain-containing protein [Desulfomicrobium escambiense]